MIIDIESISSIFSKTASHIYIRPSLRLASCIAHYTLMLNDAYQDNFALMIIPDISGCIVLEDKDGILDCRFWGITTECRTVYARPKQIKFQFFIEFLPIGAYRLFHLPQCTVQNIQSPLENIYPDLHKAVVCIYETTPTLSEFIKQLDTLFLQYLQIDTACIHFVQKQLQDKQSIDLISDKVGYSRRHLQRMFQEQVGCTMKTYQKIERINCAIQYLNKHCHTISEITHLCGYYDEAHFIHDFKIICQTTPKEYIQKTSHFYNESFKF